jgi:hypothetical protein
MSDGREHKHEDPDIASPPPRGLIAGFACAPLLGDPRLWIRRRVETIDMLAHEETHRRVSVDFALSAEQFRSLEIDDGVVVPISVLTKERRRKTKRTSPSRGRAVCSNNAFSRMIGEPSSPPA